MSWHDDLLDHAREDHDRLAMLAVLRAELEALPLAVLRGRYLDFLDRRTPQPQAGKVEL